MITASLPPETWRRVRTALAAAARSARRTAAAPRTPPERKIYDGVRAAALEADLALVDAILNTDYVLIEPTRTTLDAPSA